MSLQVKLRGYLEESGVSITRVGSMLGLSPSTMSLWLAEKYPGDNAKVARAVESFLVRQEERKAQKRTRHKERFIWTTAAKRFTGAAKIAHDEGEIGVVIGEAGVGKTMACRRYAEDNPGIILVEVDPTYTKRALLVEIHRAIGGGGTGTERSMMADLVDRLADSERLIIVDEADLLSPFAIDLLRCINDKAGVGLLLVGLPRLFEVIRGVMAQYAKLWSRVGVCVLLGKASTEDAKDLVHQYIPKADGLAAVFHELGKKNPRLMSKLLRRATATALANKSDVTEEIVHGVVQTLMI